MTYRRQGCRRYRKLLSALIFLPLVAISLSGYALASGLLILYPDVRAPYGKVYEDIVRGVIATFKGLTTTEMVGADYSARNLELTVSRVNPGLLLALGRESIDKAKAASNRPPVIVGAVPGKLEGFAGVSMTPDARLVLDKLLLLAPDVKNVYVVAAKGTAESDLDPAAQYLASRNKTLIVSQADSVVQAAEQYRQITAAATPIDAIWILRGDKLIDSTLLSVLLDTAWSKHIIIFSSNPNHVRRGTLFAVFPDNYRMGEQIGTLANEYLANPASAPTTLEPLRHVLLGVNERTVNHLGLKLTDGVRKKIDLIL
ncbi:MAG: ABC transporter substrate binding protein [Porticoccaceae bacterium]